MLFRRAASHRVRRGFMAAVALASTCLLLGACAGVQTNTTARTVAKRVVVREIGMPVKAPVWSTAGHGLLALTETDRVAKIDVRQWSRGDSRADATTLSVPLPSVGENLATSPTGHEVVYVPMPEQGKVAVLGIGDLRKTGTLPAGPAPSYVSVDEGSKILLMLSEDGTTVSGVDLHTGSPLPHQSVPASPEAEVDGAKRGRLVDYYVAGPGGILRYKGAPGGVSKIGEIGISAASTHSDLVKVSRLYVAENGTDRLLAIDNELGTHELAVVAASHLGEPIHHLGVDETRIYAVTKHHVVVFETNSYEGYPQRTFPVVDKIEYRSALPDELESTKLSGLAVGPDRVFLSLHGEPYVVSIAKPTM